MMHRRRLLQLGSLGMGTFISAKLNATKNFSTTHRRPLVISTWDAGINANKAAWEILRKNGTALDAVEAGVMVTESEIVCCVGLGAFPDRDGYVTLDACIMNEKGECGSVCFLQRIKHPVSVARLVMEKTPHVMLAGEGAQQFALQQGFTLEPNNLSDSAKKAYDKWLQESNYKAGSINHDTIGMLAIDAAGNLSGSCTTSGMAFKMHGRVGDSPIIGAGLYVDNAVGAAVATGVGEEVIKICGSHLVVQYMEHGISPQDACKKAVEKIISRNTKEKIKDTQVAFVALNKQGEYGAYSVQNGFDYALCFSDDNNKLIKSDHSLTF